MDYVWGRESSNGLFGLFPPPPHIDDSPILSTQMFPNLDHFVWELSVTKTSASPCVGIENPLFITLDPPSSFLTHVTMWKILWGRGTNRKSGLEKEDKSTLIQFLKFFSFLTDVTTTVIESPTAAEMSQPKTISHKVFPIPHYLTTWPTPESPDYLTIWLFGDRMEVRVRREVGLIIPLTDWPLLAHSLVWHLSTSDLDYTCAQSGYLPGWLTPGPLCATAHFSTHLVECHTFL